MPRIKHVEYDFVVEAKGQTRPLYTQVHGAALIEVTQSSLPILYNAPPEADGAITSESGLKLSVFTADCIPLLFFTEDPTGPIASIHCGWRGAQQSIASSIEDLWQDYPGQIHAIIGPCIGVCCFEIKEDLILAFKDGGYDISHFLQHRDNKLYFNLPQFVLETQMNFIHSSHLHTEHLRCTYCSVPTLPSYRRNKSTDPRIRGWIKKDD